MIEWASIIIDEMNLTENEILSNQEQILKQLAEIQERIQILDAKFDEQILIDVRTGLRHLLDGMNSDIEGVRNDEFLMARKKFSSLINLNPEGKTKGMSGEIDNMHLIGLGYWGNFHYFNLRGDKRNAAIQVYECTKLYPLIGLILFSSKFFSKNYSAIISGIGSELDNAQKCYQQIEGDNFWKNVWYYTKKGFVYLTAGVAGFGAGAIAGALTPGPTVFLAGGMAADTVVEKLKVSSPCLTDSSI